MACVGTCTGACVGNCICVGNCAEACVSFNEEDKDCSRCFLNVSPSKGVDLDGVDTVVVLIDSDRIDGDFNEVSVDDLSIFLYDKESLSIF